MMRRVLLLGLGLASIAGLSACGDSRLTVSGHARLENAAGDLRTGFELPGEIRLDGDASAVTGTCQIQRTEAATGNTYVATVDLFGSGSGPRAITVIGRTDGGAGTAEVQTSTAVYRADASCDVDVAYVDDGGTVTLDARSCAMTAEGATATFDAHLELHGCSVVQAD
ncbi:MAG: hypothetical protein M3Y87_28685 [Myxococcota bacterium]|nr:hypothetical protein [Myxococcota bacterium]